MYLPTEKSQNILAHAKTNVFLSRKLRIGQKLKSSLTCLLQLQKKRLQRISQERRPLEHLTDSRSDHIPNPTNNKLIVNNGKFVPFFSMKINFCRYEYFFRMRNTDLANDTAIIFVFVPTTRN